MSAAWQCFGTIIVPPMHLGDFSILENELIGYADDSILIAVVPSPGVRVAVADLMKVISEWCDLWRMKF